MLYDLTVQLRPLRHQLLYLVLCAVSLLDQTLQFTFVIVTVFIDVVRPFASGLFSVYSSCIAAACFFMLRLCLLFNLLSLALLSLTMCSCCSSVALVTLQV